MNDTTAHFTDVWGDTLVASIHAGRVHLSATEDGGAEDTIEASFSFDAHTARAAGEKLIDLAAILDGGQQDSAPGRDPLVRIAEALEGIEVVHHLALMQDAVRAIKSDVVETLEAEEVSIMDVFEDLKQSFTALKAQASKPEVNTVSPEDVEYDSTVTFLYKGESDQFPRQRRIIVDEYEDGHTHSYVVGRDLDDGESYKWFRTDRIHGDVVVVAGPR